MTGTASPQFCVLVPVKPSDVAKSRLAPLGDPVRRALVTAFALDTVGALVQAEQVASVLVTTDDTVLADLLRQAGAAVVADEHRSRLNASLVDAARQAAARWRGLGIAAVCADLPALTARDVDTALLAAGGTDAAFVADAAGTGTTMLVAARPETFRPRFGHGSRAAHLREGAKEIVSVGVPTLRRDVDTPADLAAAVRLGVGVHTARAVKGLTL